MSASKIAEFLKSHELVSGIGTRDAPCSIAAINLAMTGELTDKIPACMSEVIGKWVIGVQDAMPTEIRNSDRWKSLLPLAAGTGRGNERERCQLLVNWLRLTVLPTLQDMANKNGFGAEWQAMCEEKTQFADAADAATYAARAATYAATYAAHAAHAAADATDATRAATYAAHAAADAAADAATYAAHAAHAAADATDATRAAHAAADAAAADAATYAAHAAHAAADAATYATRAATYAATDAAAADAATYAAHAAHAAADAATYATRAATYAAYWEKVDPCGTLEVLISIGA